MSIQTLSPPTYSVTCSCCQPGLALKCLLVVVLREPPSRDQTVQGTRLLARRGASDFVLLEVVEPIPPGYEAYLNGFDAAAGNMFDEPYTISHPSGDVKKVRSTSASFICSCQLVHCLLVQLLPLLLLPILPNTRAESGAWSVQVGIFGGNAVPEGYFAPGDTHWFVAAWDEGMTEGGSSGSPVFDDSQRIRGQLHGGYASCSFPCAHQPPLPGLSGRSFVCFATFRL